jgi:predicted histone-like DNA-binding protein
MAQMTLKVRKVKGINPKTKEEGLVARVVSNGKSSFEDICELAGLNTTMNVAELEAAGKLILQAAARQLKNGFIVDLGPLGGIAPSVNGKWVAKAEDLQKSDLTAKVNYRPSDEIAAAIQGAKLAWASAEDEKKEQENGGANTTTDPEEGGEGGTDGDGGGDGNGGIE